MKSEGFIPFAFLPGAGPFIAGLALCLSFLSAPAASHSQTLQLQEYEVKAAFLFNFAKLTEWPDSAFLLHDKSFDMCILGDDPFSTGMGPLGQRIISGRKLSVKRISDIDESTACNLLYVASSETYRVSEIISFVKERPVLTVSDIKGFEKEGGIIAFFLRDNRVRFRINIEAARKAKLKISSYLLEVAEIVRESGR